MNPADKILGSIKEFGMNVGHLPTLKEQSRRGKSQKVLNDQRIGLIDRVDGTIMEPYGFTRKSKKIAKQKQKQ